VNPTPTAAELELEKLRKALSLAKQAKARMPEPPHKPYDQGVRDMALAFLSAAGEVA
jgi:hypothetical protein